MKELRFSEMLRFGLAGGVFVGGAIVAYEEPWDALKGDSGAALLALMVLIALTVGSLIYGLHRAFVHPVFKRLVLRKPDMESIMRRDLERWAHKADAHSLLHNLSAWGDQIHFLYCAAWACLLAVVVGRMAGYSPTQGSAAVIACAIMFALAAYTQERRCDSYENQILGEACCPGPRLESDRPEPTEVAG